MIPIKAIFFLMVSELTVVVFPMQQLRSSLKISGYLTQFFPLDKSSAIVGSAHRILKHSSLISSLSMGIWGLWRVGKHVGFRNADPPSIVTTQQQPPSTFKIPEKSFCGSDNRPDRRYGKSLADQIVDIDKSFSRLTLLQGLEGKLGWTCPTKLTKVQYAASFDLLPDSFSASKSMKSIDLSAGGLWQDWNKE